jgi:hypothetical protein
MDDRLVEAATQVFQYAPPALGRKHGPRGYVDYRQYKPWLRDEFGFRCVYCLCRERWEPNGQHAFSVEHFLARALHPEPACDYENLLYTCSICNACRQEQPPPLDPCAVSMAAHLQPLQNGLVQPLTSQGRALCDLCHLSRPSLVQFRRYLLELIGLLLKRQGPDDERALRHILSFPDDLPDLRRKRPPGGNSRPEGLSASYLARRARSELAWFY